ncbi:MAG: amylo-alpha-1,6-glucosidase [Candidatus Velthaea sp.]|jgi:glycogen debranching enzyme
MDEWRVGRTETGNLERAESREWLVTNGRGGYASGTVAGTLTRCYHGLLIAALAPPVERRLVVAKCEIDVTYDGVDYSLAANRWAGGAVAPQGYRWCESFALVDGVPTWTYACGDALLEQSIAMPFDRDAVALALRVVRARVPLTIEMRLLAADRDHHGGPLPDPELFSVTCAAGSAAVGLPVCKRVLQVRAPGAAFSPAHERYRGFALVREAERGLAAVDDYAHVLTLRCTLAGGEAGGCTLALDDALEADPAAVVTTARAAHRARAGPAASPVRSALAAAADAFIVRRGNGAAPGTTIVAGYHWFADWGRDTMIALPGLALHTGRPQVARDILLTFAGTIDGGMLPNRFPDDGSPPDYNTVDAALWFIEAVRAYFEHTADRAFLDEVFGALDAIVDGYTNGTRYGIRLDPDGLIRAGGPGLQLTWMDAKVDGRPITPRTGKPIEINALWYAGMRALEALATAVGRSPLKYRALAERCAGGMQRYWNAARGYCFDVLDGPGGHDPALRPNALFAVSLHACALDTEQARAVVDSCARELVTSYGLRTLGPREPGYCGRYAGPPAQRDGAYHQGTVWPWLLGPFVRAHLRVYGDVATARTFVEPLIDALAGYGIGTLGEIFDGDPPHAPRGAIAQAWSVAELIRALDAVTVPALP